LSALARWRPALPWGTGAKGIAEFDQAAGETAHKRAAAEDAQYQHGQQPVGCQNVVVEKIDGKENNQGATGRHAKKPGFVWGFGKSQMMPFHPEPI